MLARRSTFTCELAVMLCERALACGVYRASRQSLSSVRRSRRALRASLVAVRMQNGQPLIWDARIHKLQQPSI